MKALLFLSGLIFFTDVFAVQVFKDNVPTTLRRLDGNEIVSCDVIRYRLQEYAKRNHEEEYLLKWYAPVINTIGQSEALLNVLNRMPEFLSDRLNENLLVSYYWQTGEEVVQDLKNGAFEEVELLTGKYRWSDPYHGYLPDGTYMDYGNIVVVFRQKVSTERYCLDSSVKLKIKTSRDTYVFQGEFAPHLKEF